MDRRESGQQAQEKDHAPQKEVIELNKMQATKCNSVACILRLFRIATVEIEPELPQETGIYAAGAVAIYNIP